MYGIPLDRVGQAELKNGLHFAETSSRPSKATVKAVKIANFTLQICQKKNET